VQRSRRIGTRARASGTVALAIGLLLPLAATPVAAGVHHATATTHRAYQQTTLVTNLPTSAPAVQDANLKNPWGIAFGVGANATPLWVSNEGTATSTLYSGATDTTPAITKIPLTVTTPPSPTGIVVNNNTSAFKLPDGRSSKFIFDTLSGQIAGWAAPPPPTSTTTMVTKPGAVFTGLAIAETPRGPRLYAADAAKGVVRVYNGKFKQVNTFRDPRAPKNLVPYNVATIGKRIFVSYAPAQGKSPKIDGLVDVFKFGGHMTRRLITSTRLHDPWGMVVAPANWGKFGGDLLVGNVDGGAIHAYGRHSGALRGTVRTVGGKAIKNNGLWGMQFGNGTAIGTTRTLIIAAGINNYADGIIAGITPVRSAIAYTQRAM
jgi:uncharacterized protein (TIGR03118 family)